MNSFNEQMLAPFHPDDLEWRIGSQGSGWARCFAYVTNRAIMNRLDEVAGAANWQTNFNQLNPIKNGKIDGFMCGIGVRASVIDPQQPSTEWVWKFDGSDTTDFEALKGGVSGAMKRAAVSWGIGRYLYNLPEGRALIHNHGIYKAKGKDGNWYKWSPPMLPAFALPQAELELQHMQQFIRLGYKADEHGTHLVRNGYDDPIELHALLDRARTARTDYYLTLRAYQGLKRVMENLAG